MADTLLDYLGAYLTEERKVRIKEVLDNRTELITVVLEDINHAHNASAVMRTCDCFGIQNLHVIEDEHQYKVNKYIVRGSENWVSLHQYQDPELDNRKICIDKLKAEGYKIVVTSPHATKSFDEIAPEEKVALCFGAEKTGISQKLYAMADEEVNIPMYGFTESFNISVSAAVLLSQLVSKLHSSDVDWGLPEGIKAKLLLQWYTQSLKNGELYEAEFNRLQEAKSNV